MPGQTPLVQYRRSTRPAQLQVGGLRPATMDLGSLSTPSQSSTEAFSSGIAMIAETLSTGMTHMANVISGLNHANMRGHERELLLANALGQAGQSLPDLDNARTDPYGAVGTVPVQDAVAGAPVDAVEGVPTVEAVPVQEPPPQEQHLEHEGVDEPVGHPGQPIRFRQRRKTQDPGKQEKKEDK